MRLLCHSLHRSFTKYNTIFLLPDLCTELSSPGPTRNLYPDTDPLVGLKDLCHKSAHHPVAGEKEPLVRKEHLGQGQPYILAVSH